MVGFAVVLMGPRGPCRSGFVLHGNGIDLVIKICPIDEIQFNLPSVFRQRKYPGPFFIYI